MSLQMQQRRRPPQQVPAPSIPTIGHAAPEARPAVERSVRVNHGIHYGDFPIAGLRVGDARRTLTPLLNIDSSSVASINGLVVGEDDVIGEDVTALNFVKPSSLKG